MGLLADRAVGHGARGEVPEDRLDRLHLVERHGRLAGLEGEQTSERGQVPALLVHGAGVLLEDLVLTAPRRVLELEHRLGVEQVELAVAAPLVLAAPVELRGTDRAGRERVLVPAARLLGDDVEADPADPGERAREVAVDHVLVEADGLEDLRPAVALERRDPHLGHDLEDPLVQRLDVVLDGRPVVDPRQESLTDHVVQGLEGHPGVHGAGAVPDEQAHVVHLARVARLEDEAHAGTLAAPREVMVDGPCCEQARDGRLLAGDPAVGEDEHVVPVGDRLARPGLEPLQRPREPLGSLGHRVEHRERHRLEPGVLHVADSGDLSVRQHGVGDDDLAAGLRPRLEEISLRADRGLHRRHELLPDLIQGRIRDLGEQLLEVVVERPRPVRQDGERRVGAHRAERFLALARHRRQQDPEVLVRVSERDLPLEDRVVIGGGRLVLGQVGELDEVLAQPVGVGVLRRELGLDLLVVDDPAARRVHQEDPARVQALLDQHVLRRDVQHADLGGHDDQAVLRHVVARRPEPVPVEDRPDHRPVGEGDRRRTVPGLHERGVVLVEGPPVRAHRLVLLPRLRDHHEDRVGQGAAAHDQELEDVVEGGRVRQPVARDGQDLPQLVAEHAGAAQRLPGAHPVDVAPEGVDLAVVRDVPVGVRERPGRERVGAEPLVHERQRGLDVGIRHVRVHGLDLVGAQHALVDQRAAREARQVGERLLAHVGRRDGLLEELPDDVELPLEVRPVPDVRALSHEDLLDDGLHRARRLAEQPVIGGDVAPAEETLALVLHDRVEERLDPVALRGLPRQEHEAAPVLARGGAGECPGARTPAGGTDRASGSGCPPRRRCSARSRTRPGAGGSSGRSAPASRSCGTCAPRGPRRSRRRTRRARGEDRRGPALAAFLVSSSAHSQRSPACGTRHRRSRRTPARPVAEDYISVEH